MRVGMDDPQTKMLSDLAVQVGRLEVLQEANTRAIGEMAESVKSLVKKLDQSDDIAREADQRARSAHHRLDGMKNTIKWAIGVGLSVGGLMLTAIGMLWKVVEGS